MDERLDPSHWKDSLMESQIIAADKQSDGAKVECHSNFCLQSVQGISYIHMTNIDVNLSSFTYRYICHTVAKQD